MNTTAPPAIEKSPMNETAEELIARLSARIRALDNDKVTQARRHLDDLTKPLGSLGRLEEIAAQIFALRDGKLHPSMKKAVYVFAADHGITAEGVSAYPSEVTRQMVENFLAGGAAINVLARQNAASVHVVDVGVDADLSGHQDLLHHKVRRGSRNMLREAAMSEAEVAAALAVGAALGDAAAAQAVELLAIGEMGIGNTTAASAITAALGGTSAAHITGRGTGLTDEAYRHKQAVITAILEHHFPGTGATPHALEVLRRVGGLEIAAMAGMMLAAAGHRVALVIDGFISTAAAAIACALAPEARSYMFAGHRSQEPGHRILLERLALRPILDLDMRLGEGTGAVLAMPVIEAAAHIYTEMATFSSAGVSGATQ
jgi:nicotinate-nucleotide--dimethylbenzimidazole phosphoribosyltransferase